MYAAAYTPTYTHNCPQTIMIVVLMTPTVVLLVILITMNRMMMMMIMMVLIMMITLMMTVVGCCFATARKAAWSMFQFAHNTPTCLLRLQLCHGHHCCHDGLC